MIKKFANYKIDELKEAGLCIGDNVSISEDVAFHNPQNIKIGNNVRIDAQCILICGKNTSITIGNNIHISAGCIYYGSSGNITLEDYCCTSARCILYTSNDDYTQGYLTNSTVDEKFKNVTTGDITLKKHCVIGANSIILPNVTLEIGTSAGAYSLIKINSKPFDVLAGIPAKKIKQRNKHFISHFI